MRRALSWGLLALLLSIAAAWWWLDANLDRMVRDALVDHGSRMLQAPVSVDAVSIRLRDGEGEIRGLVIGNPAGFKTPYALKVQRIEIGIDVRSLLGEVVTIRRVTVLAPAVIYERNDHRTNFDVLQANLARQAPAAAQRPAPGEARKLIVGEFSLRGARAQGSIGAMAGNTLSVRLPDIELHDIGKAQGGATPAELGQVVVRAMLQKLTPAIGFDGVGHSLGRALDKAGAAIKGLFK